MQVENHGSKKNGKLPFFFTILGLEGMLYVIRSISRVLDNFVQNHEKLLGKTVLGESSKFEVSH